MKKFLFIALVGFMTLNVSGLMAQERPERKPRQEQVETLTTKQIKKVNKILANYDSESLTADDAKALMKEIREAKIPGGEGVEKAFDEAGFDFEKIKELAPPAERPNRRR
ncbi:hypothetical protein [Ancylomarina sp. 16SWW S1-10-2]|uniref:hypothetical protein n=1 Tax=Ancylomarina sp. 16SWW S1-10-2 TaxID=2499681 RepID=UPI0012ADF08F|nr:hypothetical protein [Ancylomarina sp. 16SWW S1-10-2]MRT92823.1 hypothetical protein [Ancylomarina sp. 16SWW S1-10-2]